MCKSLFACLIALGLAAPAFSSDGAYDLSEEEGLYAPVADVRLRTSDAEMRLSQVYSRQPVMLALIFTRCTGICSPFMLELSENMRALDPKSKFKVLVVSFDPRDSNADMDRYARLFQVDQDERWIFATTDQIDELTGSVAFRTEWDSTRQQFEHEALLVAVNGNGYITRKMIGMRGRKDLASMLTTLEGTFLPSYPLPGKESMLSCFTYDPVTGVRKPSYGLLVLLVPGLLTFLLVLWMGLASRRWRQAEEKLKVEG